MELTPDNKSRKGGMKQGFVSSDVKLGPFSLSLVEIIEDISATEESASCCYLLKFSKNFRLSMV
jgi:hypothetical protein